MNNNLFKQIPEALIQTVKSVTEANVSNDLIDYSKWDMYYTGDQIKDANKNAKFSPLHADKLIKNLNMIPYKSKNVMRNGVKYYPVKSIFNALEFHMGMNIEGLGKFAVELKKHSGMNEEADVIDEAAPDHWIKNAMKKHGDKGISYSRKDIALALFKYGGIRMNSKSMYHILDKIEKKSPAESNTFPQEVVFAELPYDYRVPAAYEKMIDYLADKGIKESINEEKTFYKNKDSIEKFDTVHIKSKNKTGLVYSIKGDKVEVETLSGKIVTKLADLEKVIDEGDKEEYEKFFKATLDDFGVESPAELDDEKKKEFFNAIDKGWKADGEKKESVKESAYPHKMYDPETGDSVTVENEDEHNTYAEMGWTEDPISEQYYKPKINKEKETITFVNDAEVKKAVKELESGKIVPKRPSGGKTISFQNTAEFKAALTKLDIKTEEKSDETSDKTESYEYLSEPAVSQSQQKLMAMALSYKRGEMSDSEASDKVKELAANMTEKELEDFASTKLDDLPVKVESTTQDESLSSAMKKDNEKKNRIIRMAKSWMKRTGKGPEDAVKEFDLKLSDLSENESVNYEDETEIQEKDGEWAVVGIDDKGKETTTEFMYFLYKKDAQKIVDGLNKNVKNKEIDPKWVKFKLVQK